MNTKGIPCTTVWVEYPDIVAVLEKIGAPPAGKAPDGSPKYTLPAIYDPNTKLLCLNPLPSCDTQRRLYPDFKPVLVPGETDALHAAFNVVFVTTLIPDLAQILLSATNAQLNPKSEEYFRRTREAAYGAKLEDWTPAGSEIRENRWKGVEEALDTLARWLSADGKEKLFFMSDISYADITVAGCLLGANMLLGKDSKEWQDILRWNDGRWARFMDAFEEYGL